MAIYYGVFSRFEKIQSAKLRNLVTSINTHTHNGGLGVKVKWTDIEGTIGPFYGSDFSDTSITYSKFASNTITTDQIDLSSIKINSSGYALYA
jgi:hypothetical protein